MIVVESPEGYRESLSAEFARLEGSKVVRVLRSSTWLCTIVSSGIEDFVFVATHITVSRSMATNIA